jgi:hypothetical protein
MLFELINEDRVAASVVAHGTDSEEEETSWLATASGMVNFEVTAEEIADKEIGLWKLRTVPLPKTDNPLMEWKRCVQSSCGPSWRAWLAVCWRFLQLQPRLSVSSPQRATR